MSDRHNQLHNFENMAEAQARMSLLALAVPNALIPHERISHEVTPPVIPVSDEVIQYQMTQPAPAEVEAAAAAQYAQMQPDPSQIASDAALQHVYAIHDAAMRQQQR